ncbi:MAG: E3 ubiquitin-protein ligase hrd1 [Alectoria fallacina]|uniref:E3 ubiquitin-protein ligase hrd1 n=1 Tax=Alectoria fallacina TaxID=1903189 RepID=A0A8H3FX30_9LECA|nr:MAG: E3 ubiquitin-protein ligase hrd1 [Alectoria fallacina]
MAGERLPTSLNMPGNSGDGNPRPRSDPAFDRRAEQMIAELEVSNEAHRVWLEHIHQRYSQSFDGIDMPGMLDPLDLGPPSVPLEDSLDDDDDDDDVPASLPRAGTRFVDKLPDISLSDIPKDSRSCNICMDPYGSTENPENPVRLPCGHVIGRSCIARWLTTNNSCPLCRRVLFERHVSSPVGAQAEIRRLLESTSSLAGEEIDITMEFIAVTRQQVSIEMRLTDIEAGRTPRTPGDAMELSELTRENEELDARLRAVRARLVER